MGMNVGANSSDEPEVMLDMNTTPLIDVMLVLIIMLIITIPVQLNSINLDMPISAAPLTKTVDPVVIKIIVTDNNVVFWNGTPLASIGALELNLQTAKTMQPQPELHIRSEGKAKYETVAKVMASIHRANLKKIGFVGTEQFAND
jgi:biopolymer transport protein ExbD